MYRMSLRDEVEALLRWWNAYEVNGAVPPIIDFDCHPSTEVPDLAADRLTVYRRRPHIRSP
jgi:hypothetical protein